jgi:hypothetical protein
MIIDSNESKRAKPINASMHAEAGVLRIIKGNSVPAKSNHRRKYEPIQPTQIRSIRGIPCRPMLFFEGLRRLKNWEGVEE